MRLKCAKNPNHTLVPTLDITKNGKIVGVHCKECEEVLMILDARSWLARKKYPADVKWMLENPMEIKLKPIGE